MSQVEKFFHGTPVLETAPTAEPMAAKIETKPQWPFLDEAGFYGLAGEIVKTIEPHSEADPAALLFQFLAAFGNVIGRGAYHAVEADRHGTNLFVSLVGETAKGRKGTSWGHVRRLFKLAAPNWSEGCVDHGLSSGEGLIWRVKDPVEKLVNDANEVVDEVIRDKRLLVIEGELARVLKAIGREGNTLSPVIRNAWDTGDLSIMTKTSAARTTSAHISIVGHITKNELLRYLAQTETANGFANRFLWVCVKRSKYLPEGGSLKDRDLELLRTRLHATIEFGRPEREIGRDEEAREVWRKVYPNLSGDKPGLLGAVTGRAEAQVSRLAVIYAVLDRSQVVKRDHLEAALAVWDYAETSARYIFGDTLGDDEADKILNALRQAPGGLTRTEIRDLFKRNKSAEQINRALRLLDEYGLAKLRTEETEGRPIERWIASGTT